MIPHDNGPTGREARPFEEEGLARRLAPFVGLCLLTLAIVPFSYHGINVDLLAASALLAAIVASAFVVPWARLPASWQAVPPLLLYVVAALVRDDSGGGASVFTALLLLPVVWFALYGTLNQVLVSMLGCALAIASPVALHGPPDYPSSELGRAALVSVMAGPLGATGVHLRHRIRDREELARSILDSTGEAFISIDGSGLIVEWSPQAERHFGWSRAEAIGRQLIETILPERDRRQYMPALQQILDGDRRILGRRLEVTAERRDGAFFPAELTFSTLGTTQGLRYNALLRDISERRSSEQALHDANERFRSAFDNAAIGMAIVSTDGRWTRVNRALVELTGYPPERLVGMGFPDITHPEDLLTDMYALQEMIEGKRDRFESEKRYIHADGHVIWISLSTTIVRDSDGNPVYLLSQMQDVSRRKETEMELTHRASHDELTGLPNRGVLEDRIVLALTRQRRERRPVAVLYLDLDGFKAINDTYGHDTGDYMLVAVAKRLTALLRPTDVVSRLGGDEFAIFCEAMDEQAATRLAKRIVEVVAKPIEVGGEQLSVRPSVGIALTRDPATRPAALLADADLAMYFAKDEGHGYAFFEDELRRRARGRLVLERRLKA